jgi:hypothetical protein
MLKLVNANAPAATIAAKASNIAGVSSTAQSTPVVQQMPTTLVVVDADGALIGRMRIEAAAAGQSQSAVRTARLQNGKAK